MTKQEFKEQFILQFLAAYAASRYDDCCNLGNHSIMSSLPIEDAEEIANQAWKTLERNKT